VTQHLARLETTVCSKLVLDRELARRLTATWPVFFERHGRLTDVQRAAIPFVLEGRDVILCAPTASGKTEAACAPILERNLDRATRWLILYVSPTRALVNDLYERLSPPMSRLGLKISRRTGDYHSDLSTASHMIVTTPESFDSLVCRGRTETDGHILAHAVAVVVDEIHLLVGNPRGEQVRWLLTRLRRLRQYAKSQGWTSTDGVQVLALSATVQNALDTAQALGLAATEVLVPGQREIETVNVETPSPSVSDALPAYLEGQAGDEKVLVFCNSRRRVDDLTLSLRTSLQGLGYEVLAHHGSLSKKEREEAETKAKTRRRIALVATSTLEIGIDIGDIDLIVLDGPPPDVPALLQRIGRGNRRIERTRVMLCSGTFIEAVVQNAMIECARAGDLGPVERGPCHAVARQQIASFIMQGRNRARSRGMLDELLQECAAPAARGVLLDHLIGADELVADKEGVRLSGLWVERAARGEIHSNIEGTLGTTVVDEKGMRIAVGVDFRGGRGLTVGGNLLEARRWEDRKLVVRRASDDFLAEGNWGYRSRAWMKGVGQPEALRKYLGVPQDMWPLVEEGEDVVVFHFGGGRRQAILELICELSGRSQSWDVNEWCIRISGRTVSKPAWLLEFGPASLELQLDNHLEHLERRLGRPFANRQLPRILRVDEVRQWLNVDAEVGRIQEAVWQAPSDPDVGRILRAIAVQLRRE